MTALATVAGMIPLALAWGAGAQRLQPLAIAVIGGVLASMLLSLIVTPAVHYHITRDRRRTSLCFAILITPTSQKISCPTTEHEPASLSNNNPDTEEQGHG